ncbi:MAG: hypothetical protein EU521_00430 [Promethearchaeota archaeon]|nr:MAG: hypothetical protein EU521_00430 [Candidatus Lokiarchaeota archaeon]
MEHLEESRMNLQLLYLIFRIIDFFHLSKLFDFSHIQTYLKQNLEKWLISLPLVSFKNPNLFYCGIYLLKSLKFQIDKNKIEEFLKDHLKHITEEYDNPIMDAISELFYLLKSYALCDIQISEKNIHQLVQKKKLNLTKQKIKKIETSHLVAFIINLKRLGKESILKDADRQIITEVLKDRFSEKGIKQLEDGAFSSEASYYTLLYFHLNNELRQLREYDLLENIVNRIHRNIELLTFSQSTNNDLFSEIFYSCESLKIINCINDTSMYRQIIKYMVPDEISEVITDNKDFPPKQNPFREISLNELGEDISMG